MEKPKIKPLKIMIAMMKIKPTTLSPNKKMIVTYKEFVNRDLKKLLK